MTDRTTRLILIVPAASRAAANDACAALGFGPNTFSSPFSSIGQTTALEATDYACCWAMRPADERLVLDALNAVGVTPTVQRVAGPDPAAVRPALRAVLIARGLATFEVPAVRAITDGLAQIGLDRLEGGALGAGPQ